MQITLDLDDSSIQRAAEAAVKNTFDAPRGYGAYDRGGAGYEAIADTARRAVILVNYQPIVDELLPGLAREAVRKAVEAELQKRAKKIAANLGTAELMRLFGRDA